MEAYEMKSMASTGVEVRRNDNHGQKPARVEVRRLFSFTQMFFFALSYMNSWEGVSTNIGLVFWNGGPRSVVWGFFIIIPGVLCQVASLSEMSSMQPIAGAQYHWTWLLAPPRSRRLITWVQGWITWFSWIGILAAVINVFANITTILASTAYPGYAAQGWHTILIMWAFSIVVGLLNMYTFWIIPYLELVAGLLHIVLFVVFASTLLVLAPWHSSHFVFSEKSNLSGWDSDFVSFNLGMILITWAFVGFDAVAHLGEETRIARTAVPRAMFWSICMNGALAFVMSIIFLFTLGDVDDIIHSGYAVQTIFLSATKSPTFASALVGITQTMGISVSLGTVASTSRLTWAWARDGALPKYFAYVDPRHRIPLRSIWLPLVIVGLLSLLNLINYTAFSVIISLSTFGLYQSYFLAIGCMLHARLTGRIQEAPWSLGRWGVLINTLALVYTTYIGTFLVFPSYLPITPTNMNYALPINAFVWIVALLMWFAWARSHWKGLDAGIIDKVVADSGRDTKD